MYTSVQHLFVTHRDCRPAAFAYCLKRQGVTQRFGNTESRRDGMRVIPKSATRLVLFEPSNNRRAPFGLNGDHLRTARSDPTELLHLVEGLPHTDHAYAAASRIKDSVGQLPAHLFRDFVSHRLLAFDAVRLFECADVEPAFHRSTFGDHATTIADQAVDQCHAPA